MITAIIISLKDKAALNIKKHLLSDFKFKKTKETFEDEMVYSFDDKIKMYTIKEFSIYAENLDEKIKANFFVFATKHQSEKGTPSLSVHAPGNWKVPAYGGSYKELGMCPASHIKKTLELLEKNRIDGFDVIQECTHHGPSMKKPCIFVEIGSSEKQWELDLPGRVIAKVIMELLTTPTHKYVTAFGVGGPHHTPNFKKIQMTTDIAVGHVCAKYNLEELDKDLILEALNKTLPKAELVILDWKGLGDDKERIINILNTNKITWKKTKDY